MNGTSGGPNNMSRGNLTTFATSTGTDNIDAFVAHIEHHGLFEPIGKPIIGGMGVVFKALEKNLNRHVAIKYIKDNHQRAEMLRSRFNAEAQTLAKLRHHSIITIYRLEIDCPTPFMVMPWIDGQTLRERVDQSGPLDAIAAIRLIKEVALAMSAAHNVNVIHRDLKPSNILIDELSRPVVIDFGLMKYEESSGDSIENVRPTQPGQILGSIEFIAPEQAKNPRNTTKQSDIWSLGATLYFALTGGFMRTIRVEKLPEALRASVLKATEEEASDRFESMEEFAIELEKCLLDFQDFAKPVGSQRSDFPQSQRPTINETHPSDPAVNYNENPTEFDDEDSGGSLNKDNVIANPIVHDNSESSDADPAEQECPWQVFSSADDSEQLLMMAVNPVIVSEFAQFVDETGYFTDAEKSRQKQTWQNPGFDQSDQHPVVCISWNDADAYCQWTSLETGKMIRLPSCAEWKYAFSGQYQLDPELLSRNDLNGYSRIESITRGTVSIDNIDLDENGFRAMVGNIFYWCCDFERPDQLAIELQNDPNFKSYIGSSWAIAETEHVPRLVGFARPDSAYVDVGFRVVQWQSY